MEKNSLLEMINKHAKVNGISLNPDPMFIEVIVTGLLKNEKKYGSGKLYCPCRPVTANEEMNKKIICPCEFHINEIKRDGKCHCGLFVKNG